MVVSTSPVNNSTAVEVNASVRVVFDQVMNSTATTAAFSITPPVTTGVASVSGSNLSFDHFYDFAANTTYRVNISTGARSLAGENLSANFSFQFTTGAGPPVVVSTDPKSGESGVALSRTVRVVFSLPMNESATVSSFSLTPLVAGNVSV
ncbi:MAG TPA: Ig-like domain-containing protein, partial [Thermoplasmata archaeon]|nr:Ig-like domain-containing protein [Thermoplasmata archaeon]